MNKTPKEQIADPGQQTNLEGPLAGFSIKKTDECLGVENRAAARTFAALPLRIALVDNEECIQRDVRQISEDENWRLDIYTDLSQALRRIPSTKPDVVVMDIRMPGRLGIDCIRKLKCHAPHLPVLILTANADFETIVFSLMIEAVGYLRKPVSLQQLRNALCSASMGKAVLCEEAQTAMLTCLQRAFTSASSKALPERELQMMSCLLQDLRDKEISEHLQITPNTVHVYLVRLFRHLGAHSRHEAIQKFFEACIGASCCHCHILPT